MTDIVFNVIGLAGTVLFVAAFFLLQKETMRPDDLRYLGMNLGGAVLLLISLSWHWNLSAFLLEAVWAVISLYGIVKTIKKRGV